MKRTLLAIAATCTLALFSGCKPSQTPPGAAPTPVQKTGSEQSATPFRKTTFQEVTAQLDQGGDIFVYLSPEKWLSGLSTNLEGLRELALSAADMSDKDREQANAAFGSAIRLLQASGIEDLNGVGVSGVQIAPGLYRSKLVLQHRAGKEKGFLWSTLGSAPHPLRALELLPANTGLAAFGDLEIAQVWEIVQRELRKAGVPELAEFADNWPKLFEAQTKISWPQLLQSLGGEVGMLVTLDEKQPIKLPVGEGIEFPSPALLVAIRVKNDLLYDRISSELAKNKSAVITNEPGLKLSSLSFPLPLPVRVELAVASTGDYLFVGSSVPLVRTLLAVRQGKEPGLRQQPEFQELAKHVPVEGNNFVYVSRRLTASILDIQKQAVRSQKEKDEQFAVIERLFLSKEPTVMLSVGGHTPSGWQTVSVGNTDSAAVLVALPAVGVAGMWAGLALPAVAKAKARAQTIKTVNQMKQIGLAARIYANDHDGKFPPAENWCDALKNELASKTVLKSPADKGEGECSYAYNSKLSGVNQDRIDPLTVAFFETEAGWNQHGGPELMLSEPRNPGGYVIGFADGSVQQVPASKKDSLRWDP